MIQTVKLSPFTSNSIKILSGKLSIPTLANAGQDTGTTIDHEGGTPILYKIFYTLDSDPKLYCSPSLIAPTTLGSQFYAFAYIGTNALNIITGNFTSSDHVFNIIFFIYIDRLKG